MVTVEVLPTVIDGPERGALNLNVPAVPRGQLRGIRWAEVAKFNGQKSAVNKVEDGRIHFHMVDSEDDPHEFSDLATVRDRFAAITSLHGTSEVWGPTGNPGKLFDPAHGVHGASHGHELRAPRAVLESKK